MFQRNKALFASGLKALKRRKDFEWLARELPAVDRRMLVGKADSHARVDHQIIGELQEVVNVQLNDTQANCLSVTSVKNSVRPLCFYEPPHTPSGRFNESRIWSS